MAYLHCHSLNCDWSQDDFWQENGYNPFRQDIVNDLKDMLFKDKIYFDMNFFDENRDLLWSRDYNGVYCKGTDYVAWLLARKSRSVKGMVIRTWKEWQEVKESFVCPQCGKRNLDID